MRPGFQVPFLFAVSVSGDDAREVSTKYTKYLAQHGVTGSHVKGIDWLHRCWRMADGISFILAGRDFGGSEEEEGTQQMCVGNLAVRRRETGLADLLTCCAGQGWL
jgi:hypothetical protein